MTTTAIKTPRWKTAVIKASRHFDYGDIIPFEWLYRNFELYPPEYGSLNDLKKFQFEFLSCIEHFKEKLLLDHCMMLNSSRGYGYLIVKPKDQPILAWEILRTRLNKELNRAGNSLDNIRVSMLSKSNRDDLTMKKITLAQLRTMNRRTLDHVDTKQYHGMQYNREIEVSQQGDSRNNSGKNSKKKKKGKK